VILTVRSERATERKFQGAKWPGNERARKRVGQGANRPVLLSESLRGANWPGNEKARYHNHDMHNHFYPPRFRKVQKVWRMFFYVSRNNNSSIKCYVTANFHTRRHRRFKNSTISRLFDPINIIWLISGMLITCVRECIKYGQARCRMTSTGALEGCHLLPASGSC